MSHYKKYRSYKKKYFDLKEAINKKNTDHNYYFDIDKLDETKELFKQPISIKLCEIVDSMIRDYDVGTLMLETDILHKFVNDIAENKLTDINDIKNIAECLKNLNNDPDAKDIWYYA